MPRPKKGVPSGRKGEPHKWAMLTGSKRRVTQALTGEMLPPPAPGEPIASDVLIGAAAVAEFTGLTRAQVYYLKDRLGLQPPGKSSDAA
jgi:hypothetical protein